MSHLTTEKPTVLIIHGCCHTPEHFSDFRDLLHNQGYPTACPYLPNTKWQAPEPAAMLQDDANAVKDALIRLVEEGRKKVIVVAHSYGGIVASEAVLAEFGRKAREEKGDSGGILRIVFICAILVPVGVKPWEYHEPLPDVKMEGTDRFSMHNPGEMLYNDINEHERQSFIDLLVPSSILAAAGAPEYDAYNHHPVSYLFCKKDNTCPFHKQENQRRDILDKLEGDFKSYMIDDGGHSPYISHPQIVVDLINHAANSS
ncbi:alpha beta-hydrolase [Coniophora puteana RWD-64-598 SS2]|uniref:Alpha beta-hydrolase n=1 Tax=Coniophora puteana (strain RWD-64-598) TaxID=741705 RepID=A0A5M3MHW9_CONPW|nr:alpha beta-hydrolase [Coniophora puteana RWD-64-598 SS2]EIW78693.1 alpha beta-hydrolase [Coniophora puteana RWD-64-598 SS2]